MKIQIISDIHLEFGIREFDFSDCDLLILAGDIHTGTKGLEWISKKVKDIPVIYVLGNHEYYKNSYPKLLYKLRKLASSSNIHIMENESIVIEGITFHGATLWTNLELFGDPILAGMECQQKMNDYYLIRRDPSYSKLRSIDTRVIHNESIKWLNESLSNSKTKVNVVITHHAPSIKSIPAQYRDKLLSSGFASNLESFIQKYEPDLWVHGHLHTAVDYTIGKTRVVCNPFGYPNEKFTKFKDKMIVEFNKR